MKIVLFLTGNIAPVNVPYLMRGNAQDRENDYYIAIKKWLEYKIPIVFCENSHYNSLIINELLEGRNDCEYLKFKTQTSSLGKGNGEAEIFQFAFDNSNLLKGAKYIIKVTGRYNIINFEAIQSKIKNYDHFYICGNMTHSLSWADSRFFLFKNSSVACCNVFFSNSCFCAISSKFVIFSCKECTSKAKSTADF